MLGKYEHTPTEFYYKTSCKTAILMTENKIGVHHGEWIVKSCVAALAERVWCI